MGVVRLNTEALEITEVTEGDMFWNFGVIDASSFGVEAIEGPRSLTLFLGLDPSVAWSRWCLGGLVP